LIKAGCRKVRFKIHKLVTSIWNKEELPEEWKESVILPVYKKDDTTERNNCNNNCAATTPGMIFMDFKFSF